LLFDLHNIIMISKVGKSGVKCFEIPQKGAWW